MMAISSRVRSLTSLPKNLGGRRPGNAGSRGDLVEIEVRISSLGEVLLDAPGEEHFFDLAYQGLLVAQEEVAGHLLGMVLGALARLTGDAQTVAARMMPMGSMPGCS